MKNEMNGEVKVEKKKVLLKSTGNHNFVSNPNPPPPNPNVLGLRRVKETIDCFFPIQGYV